MVRASLAGSAGLLKPSFLGLRLRSPGVHLADTLTNSHHMFPEQNNLSVFLVISSEHAGDGGLRHQ